MTQKRLKELKVVRDPKNKLSFIRSFEIKTIRLLPGQHPQRLLDTLHVRATKL
jgi:hypothetical protein